VTSARRRGRIATGMEALRTRIPSPAAGESGRGSSKSRTEPALALRSWWPALCGGWLLPLVALLPVSARAQVFDVVAAVSESELVAHVAALEFDRSDPAGQAVAAAYIRDALESYGYTVTSQPVAGSENLTATLVGSTRPDLELVLGAHFDTVAGSPGADDDASGVAAVLEAARVMAAQPVASTVHFAFIALEEFGYQGSEAYAAALAAADRNVIGMISLDMIGYTCSTPGCQLVPPDIPGCTDFEDLGDVGDFIGVGANTASVFMRDALLASASIHVPGLPFASFVVEGDGACVPDSRRSDHKSFWDEGYPAIILGDGAEARNPHYHQPTDTPDKINYDGARDVAKFMGLIARGLVQREDAPEYAEVQKPENLGQRANLQAYLGTIPDYATEMKGLPLSGVAKGGPADEAGVRGGDIIVELGGKKIENIYDYTFAIEALKVGEEVGITVLRDGEEVELKVTPGSRE